MDCHFLLQGTFPTQESNPGLPHHAAAAAAKSLQSCPTLWNPIDSSPPGSPCPWDSPGKNTGVCCHAFLQRFFPTLELNPHLMSPALAGRFFTTSATRGAHNIRTPNRKSRRRHWHPTPVLLPGKSHGRRSLVGCSPWGH